MGYIRHHAIIVTSYDEKLIDLAHQKAIETFPSSSEIVLSIINGYSSFFIPPDGSKEGWEESEAGDERRKLFIDWLNNQRYKDNSSPFSWVEIQYGDDNRDTKVIRHSDEREIIKRSAPTGKRLM